MTSTSTPRHEYKLLLHANANRAVWEEAPLAGGQSADNSSVHGRMLMGGGGGGHGGANCTGNSCSWLFDLAVDDDERVNLYEERLDVVAAMTAMIDGFAAVEVTLGLGRIVALCYRSSTLYQIH